MGWSRRPAPDDDPMAASAEYPFRGATRPLPSTSSSAARVALRDPVVMLNGDKRLPDDLVRGKYRCAVVLDQRPKSVDAALERGPPALPSAGGRGSTCQSRSAGLWGLSRNVSRSKVPIPRRSLPRSGPRRVGSTRAGRKRKPSGPSSISSRSPGFRPRASNTCAGNVT